MVADRSHRSADPREIRYRVSLDGSVLFRSWVEREEFREPVTLLDPEAERTSELLEVCAWCRRVQVEGEWVSVEEGIERLDLFGGVPVPEITHAICPECREDVLEEDVREDDVRKEDVEDGEE